MWIDKEKNSSYNFKAPKIAADEGKKVEVMFPTVEKVSPTLSSNAATVEVNRDMTVVDLGSLSAAATLTLTPTDNLGIGAKVVVKATSDGTARNVTLKKDASTTIGTISGTANTTVSKMVIWDGSAWVLIN